MNAMEMDTSTEENKPDKTREKKLTCERIPWEVQWITEQMKNHDEKTVKQRRRNKDNEMRNVINERESFTHCHTAMRLIGLSVHRKSCYSLLCS